MNSKNYEPPTADQNSLLGIGLKQSELMSLSSLEYFKPLNNEQIESKTTGHGPAMINYRDNLAPFNLNNIAEKENFSLAIDQKLLDQQQAICITNCKNFTLLSTLPEIAPSPNGKFFIQITGCEHFTIEGINCSSGRNMLFIADSSFYTIENCRCSDAEGYGVIIFNGHDFNVSRCIFDNNLAAGVLIIGNSYSGKIEDCTCSRSRGYFNHDAGIHLCSTSMQITSSHIPEKIHEALPVTDKTQRPHHIVIKNCILTSCRAQGIYLEGAINCLIEDNILLNNNKEGICFDWGSCYNIFCRNIVSLNGERKNLSQMEIEVDFISKYPLLEDNSSSMKLPGISLDNGSMNLICDNTITSNYGGGIKMIRSSFFNKITRNRLIYNTIGANEYVPYLHGITILGLGPKNNEFDHTAQNLLDFMPSVLNTISKNIIKEQLLAIFCDKESTNNYTYENTLYDQAANQAFLKKIYFRAKAYLKRLSVNLLQAFKPA